MARFFSIIMFVVVLTACAAKQQPVVSDDSMDIKRPPAWTRYQCEKRDGYVYTTGTSNLTDPAIRREAADIAAATAVARCTGTLEFRGRVRDLRIINHFFDPETGVETALASVEERGPPFWIVKDCFMERGSMTAIGRSNHGNPDERAARADTDAVTKLSQCIQIRVRTNPAGYGDPEQQRATWEQTGRTNITARWNDPVHRVTYSFAAKMIE